MSTIRRSGGAVALFWEGKLPDPQSSEFTDALARHRFRTIENAASEEVSVGWISSGDPTGDSFTTADLDAGNATWLRFRIDKKQLPRKWLAIHRDAAERAKGKKLSAKERRELKDDLMDKLLPRVLPSVNMVDALLFEERRTVLLLHTGNSVVEAFGKLFFATFQVPLERQDPLTLGRRSGINRDLMPRLDRIEPVRWPQRESTAATRAGARDRREPAEMEAEA